MSPQTDSLTLVNTRTTPQSQRADPRQVPNSAGGFSFSVSDEARIHRFLVLGTEGGTYYVNARDLTMDNAQVVMSAIRSGRGEWLVEQILEISLAGRAPRQQPAIFALAAVAGLGGADDRKAALAAVPQVCRTGTTLFYFARYVEQFRGWGRGLRRAVGSWFLDKSVDDLAYQTVKYRQREGWSMRDLLRLAHPETDDVARKALFDWICGREAEDLPSLVWAFKDVNAPEVSTDRIIQLIESNPLSWEMLPDAALNEPKVWHALIAKGMPQTALIRQLSRLTRLGVLQGDTLKTVTAQIQDENKLRKGRVHPINILSAQRTYASGQGFRGKETWSPVRQVVDALDAAFYKAFGTIEPANKRTLIALDVSGSMTWVNIAGMPLTPRDASAAMSLVTMATEPDSTVVAFSSGGFTYGNQKRFGYGSGISELSISPRQRLDDVIRSVSSLPAGGTDCSLPMLWAAQTGREFDSIVIFTDNETWAGAMHPHQALERYRQQSGIPARLVVCGMTATDFSIADPRDPGSLDVAGFDSAVPNLIADFSRGTV
jgi:60 kDa SS-A/Ro ribonucleoprotein